MNTLDWGAMLRDIASQRAVLFIGSDFLPHTEAALHLDLYKELTAVADHGVDYYHPQDGFFLFKDEECKYNAQNAAATFYKKLQPDPALVRQIAEIPFRLIISVNPDKGLERALREISSGLQFDFFTRKPNRKSREIEEPTFDQPLLYNLFGSVELEESLVLDYEDVVDHLKKMLNNENVPLIVQSILREARTYIFLGARLEKWYAQLLFQYLNRKEHAFDNRNKNFTLKPHVEDDNMMTFFKKQFNVNYFGVTNEFFDELHRRYAEYKGGEELPNLSPCERVKYYLAENNIESALLALTAEQYKWDKEDQKALVLVKSAYSMYKDRFRKKLGLPSELAVELARIRYAILGFC